MISNDGGQTESPAATPAQAGDGSPSWHRLLAVGLSLFVPGAGHFSAGRIGAGAVWLVAAFGAYAHSLRWGLVIHALCVFAAARIALAPSATARSSP